MIRVAGRADLGDVLRIERGAETAPHWPAEEYARFLDSADGPGKRVLLVAEGKGFAAASLLGAEAELESVAVAAEARRQGVGRALCQAALEWARGEGAVAMTLEVRAGSAGARGLYGQLGFVETGRRPGYYRDPADDAVLMRCELQQVV